MKIQVYKPKLTTHGLLNKPIPKDKKEKEEKNDVVYKIICKGNELENCDKQKLKNIIIAHQSNLITKECNITLYK